jgi:hypothetical protein
MVDTPDIKFALSADELKKNVAHYRNTMNCMGADAPIQSLCLPLKIEKILLGEGFLRVYDLMFKDFREVKGIGKVAFDLIASRLQEFGTMSI